MSAKDVSSSWTAAIATRLDLYNLDLITLILFDESAADLIVLTFHDNKFGCFCDVIRAVSDLL